MLRGRPILIVEDEAIIALGLAAAVRDLGGTVVGPSTSVQHALALLGCNDVDAAIVDANLIDRDVTPLALELHRQDIPFVVHTAKGLPPELASALPDLLVVMKPTDAEHVVAQIAALVGTRSA